MKMYASLEDRVGRMDTEEQLNLPLLEKIRMMDKLDNDEKEALFKIIDAVVSKKILKDNLANLAAH
jgi:hypothetical protein